MMINKELLAEVLGINDIPESVATDVENVYVSLGENGGTIRCNIYELAHEFKKWAYKKNCDIQSFVGLDMGYARVFEGSVKMICNVTAKSEPEAIFKACEWIYKNKGVNDD